MLLLRNTRDNRVYHREPCWRANLPLMGAQFLRGATFPKWDLIDWQSGLDSALRARDPHANRHITFLHDPGESGVG